MHSDDRIVHDVGDDDTPVVRDVRAEPEGCGALPCGS